MGIFGFVFHNKRLIIHLFHLRFDLGREIDVGAIVYEPPRIGATLWEIGKPDRTAAEFYIPDPDPTLSTKLYLNNSYHPQDR